MSSTMNASSDAIFSVAENWRILGAVGGSRDFGGGGGVISSMGVLFIAADFSLGVMYIGENEEDEE